MTADLPLAGSHSSDTSASALIPAPETRRCQHLDPGAWLTALSLNKPGGREKSPSGAGLSRFKPQGDGWP